MKTQNFFVGTVLSIFCFSSVCYSQKRHLTAAQTLAIEKKDIKNSAYIFEGTVIQRSTKGVELCSVIQIAKIFKGSPQLKLGTIKVVTEHNIHTKDGDPGLGRGRYIIFGRPGDSILFRSIIADNTITLTTADLSVAIFGTVDLDRPAAQWGESKYPTIDSLYSFFKENGVTVQEEVEQK
jgi:hypothetical protein